MPLDTLPELFAIRFENDILYFPDVQDHIPNVIRKSQTFYEMDLLDHLRQTLPRDGVIVDVGAHIGNHTLFFAKYLGAEVVAFEPNPEVFSLFQSTISANRLTNARVINSAVFATAATLSMGVPPEFETNTGTFRSTQSASGTKVKADTLDNLLFTEGLDRKKITAIKIDVEGLESQVIEGANETIAEQRPHLIIELQQTEDFQSMQRKLRAHGYHCLGRWCATPTYHFAPWPLPYALIFRLLRYYFPKSARTLARLANRHRARRLSS